MFVQLLDYTLDVNYQPGERMHLSNAISRLSSHDNSKGKTIKDLDILIHAIEELTGFNSLSVEKLHQHVTGYFGGILLFYFWEENLMSHVTYDVEGTQNAILDPL